MAQLIQVLTTRDRILDATERLLARYGYRKTTMDDVAREAGLSKRTLYLAFRSKEEMALSSIDRVVGRLLARLRRIAQSVDDGAQCVHEMLLCRVLFRFDAVRDYHHRLDDMFESVRTSYMARRQSYFDAEARVFARVLSKGSKTGLLAVRHPLEVAHTLILATNALLPSALSTAELGRRQDVERKADRIARLLLDGLRPRG
jgi:AcrR family transcriptional regulator